MDQFGGVSLMRSWTILDQDEVGTNQDQLDAEAIAGGQSVMPMEYKGDRQRLRVHRTVVATLKGKAGRPNIHDNTVVNDLVCFLAGEPELIEVLTDREIVALIDPQVLKKMTKVAASIEAEGKLGQAELETQPEPEETQTALLAS